MIYLSKQILNIPGKIIAKTSAGIKGAAKAAMAPPTPAGTWQYVLGAAIGAPASSVYSLLYNRTIGRIPIPPAISLGVKILLPLVPIYFVKKSNMAFGNIINGTLVGIVVAQGLNILFGLFAGNLPKLSNSTMKADDLVVAGGSTSWFDKLM